MNYALLLRDLKDWELIEVSIRPRKQAISWSTDRRHMCRNGQRSSYLAGILEVAVHKSGCLLGTLRSGYLSQALYLIVIDTSNEIRQSTLICEQYDCAFTMLYTLSVKSDVAWLDIHLEVTMGDVNVYYTSQGPSEIH